MKKHGKLGLITLITASVLVFTPLITNSYKNTEVNVNAMVTELSSSNLTTVSAESNSEERHSEETIAVTTQQTHLEKPFSINDILPYKDKPWFVVNDNIPYFTEEDMSKESFEKYSELDNMGRCGTAFANIGKDLMPTEERGSIGQVKPSGWQISKYDFVDGKYLYNRCHLIGFQLTGENANTRNLITGTRYMNVQGMLPFENMVADYVKETANHVLYRSTPVFKENNLIADGVLMEGYSVEDKGEGICFCIFAYNVQPGVKIDYADGSNSANEMFTEKPVVTTTEATSVITTAQSETESNNSEITYIGNKNSKKFHYTYCSSVDKMSENNKLYFTGTRDELISMGYVPCKNCNP